MKKYILILIIFCGSWINLAADIHYGMNFKSLGTISKIIMPDKNHMQFDISFQDSDFTLIKRHYRQYSGYFPYDFIEFKIGGKSWPDGDYLITWMDYGTKPDIPTSAFHLLLPAGKKVERVEYDTTGTHLFATDFIARNDHPLGFYTYVKPTNDVLIDQGFADGYYPFLAEEFFYRPFVYDSVSKKLWMYKKLSMKLTLKDTTLIRNRFENPFWIFCKPFLLINPSDAEKFYPEEFVGIKDLKGEDASCIRAEGKNEIGGNVKEDIRDAYVEIRNDLGMRMEKIKVPERGKFTLNLESRNWSFGLYLCTLVADGARVGTTKIIIKP